MRSFDPWIFLCYIFIPVLPLIVAVVLMSRGQKLLQEFRSSFQDPALSWREDPVYEISSSKNKFSPLADHPSAYTTVWSGMWPGTLEGCDCPKYSSWYTTVEDSTIVGDFWTQPHRKNCECYAATPAQPLTKLVNGKEIFVLRIKYTSFLDVYTKMNQDGSCQEGFKNCGDKSSVSKGYCIPISISECPMTALSNTNARGIGLISSGSVDPNSLSSQPEEGQPVALVSMVESNSRYPLLNPVPENPVPLHSYTWSFYSDQGQLDLFDINSVPYSQFNYYEVDNQFKYQLVYSKPLEWRPECSKYVSPLNEAAKTIEEIGEWFNCIFWLFYLLGCVGGIQATACRLNKLGSDEGRFPKVFTVSLFFFYLPLILLILLLMNFLDKVRGLESLFDGIVNMECSSKAANSYFKNFQESTPTISRIVENAFYCPIVAILYDFVAITAATCLG